MLDLTKYDLWFLLYKEQKRQIDFNLEALRSHMTKPYSDEYCEGFQKAMDIISNALLEKNDEQK